MFYGFELEVDDHNDDCRIERRSDRSFGKRASNWVISFNHNCLRSTRIVHFLRVLELEKEARAFIDAVESVHGDTRKINDRSLMF